MANIENLLDPYFLALGRVAHSWNHLHEELGKVFCALTRVDLESGMAIWHALKSDRSQRDILVGALIQKAEDEDWVERHPGAKEGLLDLISETNKLAERRNTAVHAPCNIVIAEGEFQIIPITFFRNDKAKKLVGKDILKEFRWYEQFADALREHATDCRRALDLTNGTWPKKPLMPTLGQEGRRN